MQYKVVDTVHSESIQTPSFFPHFVTLQPYTKIDTFTFFSLINPHTIPHNDKYIYKYIIYISIHSLL